MIILAKNTLFGDICLDNEAMEKAIKDGRSESDCSCGEFVSFQAIYKAQFGPEEPDYNLRNIH